MFIFLLLGIALGIILESFYINILLPIIQIRIELHKVKQSDVATQYALHTEQCTYEFYKNDPEAKLQPEFTENTNAIGFKIDTNEEDESEEEDSMGFKI